MFAEDKGPGPEPGSDPWADLRSAVAHDLLSLAVLHDKELDADFIGKLKDTDFPTGMGLQLCSEQGEKAVSLMRHGVDVIPENVGQATLDELATDYADIYLTHTLGASPNESVWLDEEGLAMQEPMFEVREYYRRHGLSVQNWRKRSDDHLVHQLQFLSLLFAKKEDEGGLKDAAQFMDEHLLRWLPGFGRRVASRAATPFYAGLAVLSLSYAEELRELLVEILGEPRPSAEEIEKRMKPRVSAEVAPPAYVPGTAPSW